MADGDRPIPGPLHPPRPPAAPRGTNPQGCDDCHGDPPPRDLPPATPNYRQSDTNARIDSLIREDKPRRRIQTLFPYLLVRSMPGDRGARPLDQSTGAWWWESCDILLMEGPGPFDFAKTNFFPVLGHSYRVFVHVWNLGRFAAYGARLRVWSVGNRFFLGPPDPLTPPTFVGGTYFDLGDRSSSEAHRLIEVPATWTIANAGDTLFAGVDCATDPWDGVFDPPTHRHVAQCSFIVVARFDNLAPVVGTLAGAVSQGGQELRITSASLTRASLAGPRARGLARSDEAAEGWNPGGLRPANDDRPLAVVRQTKAGLQFYNVRAAPAVPRPGAKLGRATAIKGELREQLPALLAKALGVQELTAGAVAAALGDPAQPHLLRFVLTGPQNQMAGFSVLLAP